MELVTGKTLREVILEESPLTAREAIAILEPILLALRAAHTAGIIHRDVKPENVIVRRDGEVKVADFGLARAITNETSTSQTGVLLGTVSYLSPEQVERGVADQRSDLYAAGLLLFEMLTGRKAVTGDTPIQIAYKHVHGSIEAPLGPRPRGAPRLDDLVARATALEPDDRFASAADFLRALAHVRRDLTPAEIDHRGRRADAGTPLSPVLAVTSALPTGAGHPTPSRYAAPQVPPTRGRPRDSGGETRGIPAPARSSPSHHADEDDGRSHTTALPVSRGRRRRWPWALLALLVAVGGVAGGWWFTTGPGATTVVPTVVGRQADAAETALTGASLVADTSEEFSERSGRGVVLRVDPGPGTELSKDSTVHLVVSKGPERYAVPTLVGTAASGLPTALGPVHLRAGESSEAWSETVRAGRVISQDPEPGTSVKRGTAVSVVVSKGRRPLDVPSVVGSSADAAAAAITKAGLTPKRADDVNSDTVPAGQVVSQKPSRGTLFRGDTVTLTVSKGPVMVTVPGVVGRPVAEAEKALTDLGLTVKTEFPFGRLFDLVRVQSVEEGASVPKGSTIILTIV